MESINESVSFHSIIESHIEELCNGSGKLCISPFLLSHINEALDILKNNGRSSPVVIPYELKIVLFNLEHVLKVITKLKVNQRNVATFSGPFNLKLCSSLKDAEFIKISLDNVQGLDSETNEICCISCVRCMNVFDLFTNDVWSNLKNLTLSYCQLNKIDSTILGHLRTVERLDLSFNNLKSLQDLDSLTKLVLLDISYNYLEEVPRFSEESNKSLTELYMSHNNFTSLNGIKKLSSLNNLDASDNCIYEKESLVDLYYLKQLKWLKLSNNPLSFRKHYRMYVSHFLGTVQPPYQFLLDEIHLKDAEIDFMGSSRGIVCSQRPPQQATTSTLQSEVAVSSEVIQQAKGILKSSNRKGRKGREVVIVDAVGDPGRTPASLNSKKTGVVLQETVTLNAKPSSYGEVTNNQESDQNSSKPEDDKPLESETRTGNNINELEIPDNEVILNDIINQTMKHSYHSEMHSSPESTQTECRTVEVTVHASHEFDHNSESTNETSTELITTTENVHYLNDEIKTMDIDDIRLLESIDLILQNDTSHLNVHSNTDSNDEFLDATSNDNDVSSEFVTDDNTNNNSNNNNSNNRDSTAVDNNASNVSKDSSNSDDSAYEDDLNGDENLWPVQKLVENSKPVNMFLVLLDTELRERSTISGRTIATMPLAFIQSCTQINPDPITVELVFSSLLKHTTVRTYIMEFADAQTLMNKMNVFLASRPDVVEEQLTSFLCKSCNAFFSVYKTQARTLCTVCGSSLVTEMETGLAVTVEEHSNSSSQSSEVSSSLGGIVTKTSNNNITNPSSVSTVSSEPSEKLICNFPATSTPQKYESDVEIISNPSQSSIEILDDRSSPSRKRSSEERHVNIASTLSPLVEVSNANLSSINEACAPPTSESEITSEEVTYQTLKDESDTIDSPPCDQPPLKEGLNNPMMTESSSSGSVLTSYEANVPGLNTTMTTSITYDIPEVTVSTTDTSHETDNSTTEANNEEVAEEMHADIYSYTDFTDVDHRVKAYLYQYVFHDDSEELNLLVRCHLWKTGGTDYPACFVLSNRKMYILMHTSTEYGLDASDWLKLQESNELKSIKKIYPLIWHLGVGFQINRLSYFILLFDKTYTDNLLSFVKSISLKGCDIGSKSSSKVALSLQQLVLTSNFVHDVIDPTILLYTVCLKIKILTDDDAEETMTLGGFVITPNEFYVVIGDFGWLGGSGDAPSIHFFQMMNHLIEIKQKGNIVSLHFLDETEAVEVVWYLHCFNHGHVSSIIDTMRVPWETVFNEPLQVN